MSDFVLSTLSKVAEYLAEPGIQLGRQCLCVNQFIKDLENEKKELISERDNLLDRVEQAKQ